jgi:hypothetical protein
MSNPGFPDARANLRPWIVVARSLVPHGYSNVVLMTASDIRIGRFDSCQDFRRLGITNLSE